MDPSDIDGSQDLLSSSEKLDEYLKTLNIRPEPEEPGSPDTPGASSSNSADGSKVQSLEIETPPVDEVPDTPPPPEEKEEKLEVLDETPEGNFAAENNAVQDDTMSDDSYGQPLSPRGAGYRSQSRNWASPDVVSLDEYEFSDSEASEISAPHTDGLRKAGPSKKLPLRRDFELVRRESVSSLGARSGASVAESMQSLSRVSMESDAAHGSIEPWHLQVMLEENSDDGEPGDATAALRRLEGQIDSHRQQHKEKRVDGWLRTVRRRVRNGETGEEDHDHDAASEPASEDDVMTPDDDVGPSLVEGPIPAVAVTDSAEDKESIGRDTRTSNEESTADIPVSPIKQEGSTSPASAGSRRPSLHPPIQPKLTSVSATKLSFPTRHRSFILQYPSETLAKHWALIDRDILLQVKFEELTLHGIEWAQPRQWPDVYDWALFYKERMRLKLEARVNPEKQPPTSIMSSRMRFNVMVNFVASEIVLTTGMVGPACSR